MGSLHRPWTMELPTGPCLEPYQRGPQVIGGLSSSVPQPHVHDPPNGRLLAREVVVVLVIGGWFLLFLIPGRSIKPSHSGGGTAQVSS